MNRRRALLLVAFALGGCSSKDRLVSGCLEDADCGDPAAWRCDESTAQCLCRTAAACKEGEFCNSQGYCQAQVGCYENRDCPTGFFCDVTTNNCLAAGRCAIDLHCKPGELCDAASATCKPGCRVHGDCGLREVCLCPAQGDAGAGEVPCGCAGATDAERAACPIGRCGAQTCADDSFCGWGQVCRVPESGGLPTCRNDYDPDLRPYCSNCVYTPGGDSCGRGANFCLYSTYTGGTYCGVDCSQGQSCPNGYDCRDVIVVWTRTQCRSTEECMTPDHRSDIPCERDEDCPNHGMCGRDPGMPTGFCYGACTFHEGANQSFCACVADEDCAQDSCVAETRTCSISKRPCDPKAGGCTKIRCVDFGNKGGCLIGQNCKPVEGLTCADVAPQ